MVPQYLQQQQFTDLLYIYTRQVLDALTPQQVLSRLIKRSRLKWVGVGLATTFLVVNWMLVLSAMGGLLVMLLIYRSQRDRRGIVRRLRTVWNPSNQPIVLSILGGVAATVSVYLALLIWQEWGNAWLAIGVVGEGLTTLVALSVLTWLMIERHQSQGQRSLDQMLVALTDQNALKRLIAVRQLTHEIAMGPLSRLPQVRSSGMLRMHLSDCFHVMLNREQDPILRNALLEGLQALSDRRALGQGVTRPVRLAMKQAESVSAQV